MVFSSFFSYYLSFGMFIQLFFSIVENVSSRVLHRSKTLPHWQCYSPFCSRQHQASQAAAMPNKLQSTHSFIHLLLLLYCPPLYSSSPPQPHPALHHYLSLYLPACLSRPLSPSHFHSYNALFCFHAASMEVGGWREGGSMDGGMILHMLQQQEEKEEEQAVASWRAYLSLS